MSWGLLTDSDGNVYLVDMARALKVLNEIEMGDQKLIRCECEDGRTVDVIAERA